MPYSVKKVCLATCLSGRGACAFMKKESDMNQIAQFMAGAQDMSVFHQDTADGFMDLTAYYILPGIYLTLNDIHTQVVPSTHAELTPDILLINYCMEGRCEFRIDEDNYSYLDNRLMNISSKTVQDHFYYPSSFYKGYEIYILPDRFTDKTVDILRLFGIDIEELIRLYTKGAAFYVSDTLLKLWNRISESHGADNLGQLRLSTLHLLKYIGDHKPENTPNILYLSRVQVMLAKRAQEMLTEDPGRHTSMKSVSEALGVSESSLKRYFRAVYGTNVSAYMHEMRMKYAAELLATSKFGISEIAKACGYANQGRFAKVFRQFYGMKPLDYRRHL